MDVGEKVHWNNKESNPSVSLKKVGLKTLVFILNESGSIRLQDFIDHMNPNEKP